MTDPEERPPQNQEVKNNSGQVGQARRDLYQILIQIGSSDFIKDKLEELSFWSRPLHFFRVLFFLLRIIVFWFFMGFSTKYKFPFNTLQSLIYKTITGEIVDYVAQSQPQNSKALADIVKGINRSFVSIDDKISLELHTEIIIHLIDLLSSKDIEKKEDLSEFLGALNIYYDSFVNEISGTKREKYRELYEWQNQNKIRKTSGAILKFVNQLISFSSDAPASDSFIYNLLDKTKDYIIQNKRVLSVRELADIKQIERFVRLISEKNINDVSNPSQSLQYRHDSLSRNFEELSKQVKANEKENDSLRKESDRFLKKLENARSEIFYLEEQKFNLQNELRAELERRDKEINQLKDPIFYLRQYSKITHIAKSKKESPYHDNPNCHHWRGLILDYIFKENRGESLADFLVSNQYDDEKFRNKKKCGDCDQNSTNQTG